MTVERWIVIPRWDEFQHRDMARSSVPPWIKTYTKLMGDDDFLSLSFHLRGLLVSLWLEYATARRQLSGSTVTLSRRLGMKVTTRDLERLNHAGYLTLSASKPASDHASAPASLEVEVEREKRFSRTLGANPASRIRTMIRNGAISDQVMLTAELRDAGINGTDAATLTAELERRLA